MKLSNNKPHPESLHYQDAIQTICRKLLTFSCAASAISQIQAVDHISPFNSVDFLDQEMRYEDNTKYDTHVALAIPKWEALTNCPDIKSATTDITVELGDYNNTCDPRSAYWDPNGSPDSLYFNIAKMDAHDPDVRTSVAIHEFGHALGLLHCDVGSCYMNDPVGLTYNSPFGTHELSDYDALYND